MLAVGELHVFLDVPQIPQSPRAVKLVTEIETLAKIEGVIRTNADCHYPSLQAGLSCHIS